MRVVIVGGVAGGATAAARARRLSELSQIIMLERGKHVSIASCGLPFHVSGMYWWMKLNNMMCIFNGLFILLIN